MARFSWLDGALDGGNWDRGAARSWYFMASCCLDLWEVNEAFAVVPMAFMQELDISRKILNIHGGACAMGHPIGASGARIMVTLLNALERYGLKRGVAAVCIGGGEGTAIAIERAQ